MTPGTIVICTDARLSEGRLVEGWRYVVREVLNKPGDISFTSDIIPDNGCSIMVYGAEAYVPGAKLHWWKSSRFRPLERKDVEDKVNSVIADKIIGKMGRV